MYGCTIDQQQGLLVWLLGTWRGYDLKSLCRFAFDLDGLLILAAIVLASECESSVRLPGQETQEANMTCSK